MTNDNLSAEFMDTLLCNLLTTDVACSYMDGLQKDLKAAAQIPDALLDDLLVNDVVKEAINDEEQNRNSAILLSQKVNKAWYSAFSRGILSVV